jgi:hypothetical protein
VIYLQLDITTVTQGNIEELAQITICVIQQQLQHSGRNFQIITLSRCTNGHLGNEFIVSVENVEALKAFQQALIAQASSAPWLTNADSKIWALVKPVLFEGGSLEFVPDQKDCHYSLAEVVSHLKEEKRIEVLKWNIHSSALILDKGLINLPEDTVITDNEFLKRVATANHMLSEHGINQSNIGSGVSRASTVESVTENVVGYRRETLSLEDLHAEYAALNQLFRTMVDNPPASEQAPE